MQQTVSSQQLNHPTGLWLLSLSYAFFTLSFGTINSLLVLYVTANLNFSQSVAYGISGGFNAIVWTFPVLGGYLATKFGYKFIVLIGLILCTIGAFLLNIHQAFALYCALGVYVVGYGMVTPGCFSMVGFLYGKEDSRRESAYTIFYLLFNFGFLLSGPLGGYLSQDFGYPAAFTMAAIAILISLVIFASTQAIIKPHTGRSFAGTYHYSRSLLPMLATVIIGSIICAYLLEHIIITNWLMFAMVVLLSLLLIVMAYRQRNHLAKKKLLAYIVLAYIALVFWSLYALEPSLLTLFIENNVDRSIGTHVIPPSFYYSLDPLYVIIFGILLSFLWRKLAAKNRDLSLPTKFSLAIIVMGVGIAIFYLSVQFTSTTTHLTSQSWVFIGYIALAVSELLLAPIGLAMIGRLSPHGQEGLLMGIWTLFTGFAAIIGEELSKLTAVDNNSTAAHLTNPIYSKLFLYVSITAIVIGLLSLLLIPWLKSLIKAH